MAAPAPGIRPARARTAAAVAIIAAGLLIAGCGSGSEQNANEPHGYFPVKVTSSWTTKQTLAQTSEFVVDVTNAGTRTIPNVAVSVINPKTGDAAQSFGYLLPQPAAGQPLLASRSRPVWVVMQNPGPCGYSCKNLGPGGAASAYTDTWQLGRLKPGRTAHFAWKLEAVKAGTWQVQYQVAAGLNGDAKAELAGAPGHQKAYRTYTVTVAGTIPQTHVKPDGKVVYAATAN